MIVVLPLPAGTGLTDGVGVIVGRGTGFVVGTGFEGGVVIRLGIVPSVGAGTGDGIRPDVGTGGGSSGTRPGVGAGLGVVTAGVPGVVAVGGTNVPLDTNDGLVGLDESHAAVRTQSARKNTIKRAIPCTAATPIPRRRICNPVTDVMRLGR